MSLPKRLRSATLHNDVPALEAQVLAGLLDHDLRLRLLEDVAVLDLEMRGMPGEPLRVEVTAIRTRRGGPRLLVMCSTAGDRAR